MQDRLPTKRVNNQIIVDESGSMSVVRKQAFVGMNETLPNARQMHLEFQQDEADTKAMIARERHSRERYNCCVAEDAAMPIGSFFEDEN